MRIPMSWLREYAETPASTAEIAARLGISSLEVDRVIDVGVADEGGNLGHFVVGRVVSAEPHPNADRLQLCQVDVGNADPQQIVCGAWNFGAGATVAVGLPGAHLPGFPGPLEERPLRGQVSRGMILAEDEIGLGADHDGIMLLPDGLTPGTPLADVLPLVDQVLDATPTMNRPDLLSMVGIAREVAALCGGELRLPEPGRSARHQPRARRDPGRGLRVAARATSDACSAASRSGRPRSGSAAGSISRGCGRSRTSST